MRAKHPWMVIATLTGLIGGGIASVAGAEGVAAAAWAASGVIAGVPLVLGMVASIRKREWGLDVIAILAIAGAVALGEYLAAAIVGLMLATGEALDAYAAARAAKELTGLLERAPRNAHLLVDGVTVTVDVGEVRVADRLVVKSGEIVPVDGTVVSGTAVLDESSLTGEALAVSHPTGGRVASGTLNGGDSFEMMATTTAAESTYAGIVRLVEEAQDSKAPVSRLADRYAIGFVPLAIAVAAAAWLVSGDPVRGLAVLVVATPCPLLLAVPIAIISGISRAAARGVVVKGGGVLERLADAEILVIDKTGTLTSGKATVTATTSFDPALDPAELLHLGASLDQMSNHVLATALVSEARARGAVLAIPASVSEELGSGITGIVEDRWVSVGTAKWVAAGRPFPEAAAAFRHRSTRTPSINVYISVDGEVVGAFTLADEIRPDSPRTVRALRAIGIKTVIMATGDHPMVADAIGASIGVDRILSQCVPADKVAAVQRAISEGVTVMVGDGINDAPALAIADVGVAMGARGATSSSDAADIVLVVDRLDRLVDAIEIAHRSRSIARQSAFIGMGLSGCAMAAAAIGWLDPVGGALVQEGIDVLAILSALRALGGTSRWNPSPKLSSELSTRLKREHLELLPGLSELGALADSMASMPESRLVSELTRIDRFLTERVLPHEVADEREIYPVLSEIMGGHDPMAAMSLTHGEIFRLTGLYHRLVEELSGEEVTELDLADIRRVLYGLDAVLRLHFAQEEELYQTLDLTYHDRYEPLKA